jgi:putative ABC transport system substrate-binding protein
MNRRNTIIALATLGFAQLPARAQPARKPPVVAFLSPGSELSGTGFAWTGLRDGMRAQGYIDGQSVVYEGRWANGRPEQLPRLAQELVQLKVDVLVAVSPAAVRAAKAATSTIPIVAHDLETEPMTSGLVASLARPGSNLTGLFLDLPALAAKWLQLIREVVPATRRVRVLWDANTGESQLSAIKAAASAMSVETQVLEFRDANGIENALNAKANERAQALVQLGSPIINQNGRQIADILASQKLPAISPFRSFCEAGGMMSYGPNLPITYRSLAPIIAKILKGAKPGDLPVEQPTHFEMVVNLKAAAALGIKVPQSVLLRADEVIR